MAFELVTDSGNSEATWVPISSLTLSAGDMLELDVGATTWTTADSSTQHWQRKAICIESATSSDTEVKVILVKNDQLWKVETANASSDNHDGDRMVLTDQNTVNNTGTDSTAQEAIFVQKERVGATSDNRVIGYFVEGSGINPDAA